MGLGFIFLAIILLMAYLIDVTRRKPFYPFSKTGKPFEEYDEDGFLTHEAYQSHIAHYNDGAVEVDLGALVRTRKWHDDMEACRKMREYLEQNKVDPK